MAIRKDYIASAPPLGPDDEPGSPTFDAWDAWFDDLTDEEIRYMLEQDGIDVDESWRRCKAKLKDRLGIDLDEDKVP